MKKFDLKEVAEIREIMMYFPYERLEYYLSTRYNYHKDDCKLAFNVLRDFPQNINHHLDNIVFVERVVSHAIEIYQSFLRCNKLNSSFKIPDIGKYSDNRKEIRKFVYRQDGQTKEVILDLNDTNSIITYAKILEQAITPVALLKLTCQFTSNTSELGRKEIQVFEGDMFNAYDNFYGPQKSNIYISTSKSDFQRLLYIKGKGYLTKTSKLNIEEGLYSYYVVSGTNRWVYMGNIYTSDNLLSMLKDDEPEQKI